MLALRGPSQASRPAWVSWATREATWGLRRQSLLAPQALPARRMQTKDSESLQEGCHANISWGERSARTKNTARRACGQAVPTGAKRLRTAPCDCNETFQNYYARLS